MKRANKKTVVRISLLTGIILFTASAAEAQTTTARPVSGQAGKSGVVNVQPAGTAKPVLAPAATIYPAGAPEKMGTHAPDPNDPDFAAKKEEWMKNYPDEYKASLSKNSAQSPGTGKEIIPGTVQPASAAPQKVAEHAPDINDPDYQAKKIQWIKNYPQEYQQLINPASEKK